PAVQEMMDILEEQDFLDRLWVKDATLGRGEVPTIRHRLGWLTSPTIMKGHTDEIRSFADEIRRLQFSHVVLLGMGGAALAADVFNLIFGSKMGFPDLVLLDSTDPAAVKQTLQRLNLARTLFVVASKSGDTPETLAFYEYFRRQMEASSVPRAGTHFGAHPEPGRPPRQDPRRTGFPPPLPHPRLHRRALLCSLLLRPGARRAHGHRRQVGARSRPRHGRGLRQCGGGSRQCGGAPGRRPRGAGPGGPRQGHSRPIAPVPGPPAGGRAAPPRVAGERRA